MHAFEIFVNICDAFLVSYFIRMCLFVVLVGPLFVWFVLLSSPRVALLDCSVLLLSSLCFVLLCLASLLIWFFGILILASPLTPLNLLITRRVVL